MDDAGFTVAVRVLVQMVAGVPVIESIDIVAVEPVQATLPLIVPAGAVGNRVH